MPLHVLVALTTLLSDGLLNFTSRRGNIEKDLYCCTVGEWIGVVEVVRTGVVWRVFPIVGPFECTVGFMFSAVVWGTTTKGLLLGCLQGEVLTIYLAVCSASETVKLQAISSSITSFLHN